MKKTILITLIGLASGLSSFAQGLVNFNNNYQVAGALAAIKNSDGTLLGKGVGKVEILDGAGQVISDPAVAKFVLDGVFYAGTINVPGTTATIRTWDSTTGATYAEALSRSSIDVTLTKFGVGTTPPFQLSDSSSPVFAGATLSVVPEPSTVALAALGVAGLFFVARRK